MAAVGAPEVITQLESAAKVLMVRTSSLFSPSVGAVKHVRAVSGGFRRLETVADASLVTVFCKMCPVFSGETFVSDAWRLALAVSIPLKIRLPSWHTALSPARSSTTAALIREPASGHFLVGFSCAETSVVSVAVLSAANIKFQRTNWRQLEHLGLVVLCKLHGLYHTIAVLAYRMPHKICKLTPNKSHLVPFPIFNPLFEVTVGEYTS